MGTQTLLGKTEALLQSLERARERVSGDIDDGLNRGSKLRDATREVADSSSGSWVGWHSRMYYRDYEEPPLRAVWNVEWGGLRSFDDGWQRRSIQEVQEVIEERASTSLAELATTADRVREVCQPLQEEVLTVLSPICDLRGLEREADILADLDNIKWIMPPQGFVEVLAPREIRSRDQSALNQGRQAPLHIEVEAAIVSNTSTLTTSRDFLKDAIRVTRQVKEKLSATPASQGATSAGMIVDSTTARQLRNRSIALFVVLSAAVTAGAMFIVSRLENQLAVSVLIVGAALVVGGFYAVLIDRHHARQVLAASGGVGGAIAAIDQILGALQG